MELGFGTGTDDGYTWAMIVQTDDHELLNELVWQAAETAFITDEDKPMGLFFLAYQTGLAETKVFPLADKPRTSLNQPGCPRPGQTRARWAWPPVAGRQSDLQESSAGRRNAVVGFLTPFPRSYDS